MKRPLTILHVETGTNLYGGALQVLYLLRGLREHRVNNLLVCPRSSQIAAAADGIADRIYRLPMAGDLDLRFLWHLIRTLRHTRPDILHLHSRRGADILGGIAGRLTGIAVVLSRRVDNPERPAVARLKYCLFHRVITISHSIRDMLLATGVDPDKVVTVHSAVDGAAYNGHCDRGWFEREFALPPQARVCAMIAQFIPRKGHRTLLDSIPRILARVPTAVFIFFGKGSLLAKIQATCRDMAIDTHVRFAGYRDDMDRIMGCLHVVAHPAEREGLGVSLLQAAAAAVPLVATATGGIPEILQNGINGHLIPVGDSEALASAIIDLLSDPTGAKTFGQAGQRIVAESFSISRMVEGNLKVYADVLQHRRTLP